MQQVSFVALHSRFMVQESFFLFKETSRQLMLQLKYFLQKLIIVEIRRRLLEKASNENIRVHHSLEQTDTKVCTNSLLFSHSSDQKKDSFYRHCFGLKHFKNLHEQTVTDFLAHLKIQSKKSPKACAVLEGGFEKRVKACRGERGSKTTRKMRTHYLSGPFHPSFWV